MKLFRKRTNETNETPKLPLMKAAAISLLRHLLTFIGGALVAKGFIDTESLQEIIGAIISIVSVSWMAVSKYNAPAEPKA